VWWDRPYDDPLRLYLDSLARFRPLPADALVLPSHGLPFRGLHARLDALRAHHDERLAETLDALGEPRSAADLLPVLFRRKLDTHQMSFAIGEALAHLSYLEAAGSVTRTLGADGIERYRKA
jgi:glyoxylase-like metal-dependent hydrolase (beta-lactamase superfamily II)